MAAILERVQQAQKGRGDVTACGRGCLIRHSGSLALARELESMIIAEKLTAVAGCGPVLGLWIPGR
jgi:hypothetical protein